MSFVAKYTLALVVCGLALSCASHVPLKFRFDPDTTAVERTSARRAFATWNDAGISPDDQFSEDPNGPWRMTFTSDPKVLRAEFDGRTCTREDLEHDCAHANWVRVRRGKPTDRTFIIVLHEEGHALGLQHVADPVAVMNPWGTSDELTAADYNEMVCVGVRQGGDDCDSIAIRKAAP